MVENEAETMPVPQHRSDRSQAITETDRAQACESNRRYRFIRWALKGMLSVIIVLVFIALGKSIAILYESAPSKVGPSRLVSGSQLSGPMMVGFGDAPYTIFRQEIDGDLTTASIHLKNVCFNVTQNSGFPAGLTSNAEQTLLQTLLNKQNHHAVDGVTVCAISPGNPTFVGIKSKSASESHANLIQESRIIAWGFATQMGNNRWKLQVVSYDSPENFTGFGSMKFALPPNSQRLLHMDSPGGESVMAFTSRSDMGAQIDFFNQFFEDNDWKQESQWSRSKNDGHGAYTRMHKNRTQTITIHLQREQINPETEYENGHQEGWQGIISLARHSLRP